MKTSSIFIAYKHLFISSYPTSQRGRVYRGRVFRGRVFRGDQFSGDQFSGTSFQGDQFSCRRLISHPDTVNPQKFSSFLLQQLTVNEDILKPCIVLSSVLQNVDVLATNDCPVFWLSLDLLRVR